MTSHMTGTFCGLPHAKKLIHMVFNEPSLLTNHCGFTESHDQSPELFVVFIESHYNSSRLICGFGRYEDD